MTRNEVIPPVLPAEFLIPPSNTEQVVPETTNDLSLYGVQLEEKKDENLKDQLVIVVNEPNQQIILEKDTEIKKKSKS